MDKLRILRSAEPLFKHLDAAEIRMYLLLLAGCDENGEGVINCKHVRQTFGGVELEAILKGCGNLRKQGLIEVVFLLSDGVAAHDFLLRYKIKRRC